MCHGDLPVSFRFYLALDAGGFSPDRPPVGPDPRLPAQTKLFCSPLRMALGAEAADVAVFVRSAMAQRDDVIRCGRLADNPGGGAIAAEGLCL